MKIVDYISPIEKELREGIIKVAERYLEDEGQNTALSPRWLNYHFKEDEEEGILFIRSTQCGIGFSVVLPEGYPRVEVNTFWNQFKEFRTDLLVKEYPMINPY